MEKKFYIRIAEELNISTEQIINTSALLESGATVPFISRYRKELTGSLDEVAVMHIRDRLAQLQELEKRRDGIIRSIQEQGKMTDQLREQLAEAATMTELEDIPTVPPKEADPGNHSQGKRPGTPRENHHVAQGAQCAWEGPSIHQP